MRACLSELNKELRFSHFEIRGLNDRGTETYGIVNTVGCVRACAELLLNTGRGVALT